MAPLFARGAPGRSRGAARAVDDPLDRSRDRRVDGADRDPLDGSAGGRVDGVREGDPALGLSGLRVEGRSASGLRSGCVDFDLGLSGGGRVPRLGTADRRSRLGRLGPRASTGGAVTRPPPVPT